VLANVDPYQDIREAVRDLCSNFPAEYFRKIDEERAYPETFVQALTDAGWLAAQRKDQYTEALLNELGFTTHAIRELRDAAVI
jgi:acyl-CoA dehydrogenase